MELARLAKPRPTGTYQNREIADYVESYLKSLKYEILKVPFDCKVWEDKESFLIADGNKITLYANPYSEAFSGRRSAVIAENLKELEKADCKDKILFLTGDLAKESLQPKDYPFYFPDEHKAVIDCLEEKNPCAIVAVTGKSSMSGQRPFYLIEDGNFHIPIASLEKDVFPEIRVKILENELELSIDSQNKPSITHQLIASKKVDNPEGTIVICAHMDSKYNTSGALDNASGLAAMLYAARKIESDRYNIDIVPFNSEEYYDPQGELIYLDEIERSRKDISLLINIDTVAHAGSKVAVASFNLNDKEQHKLDNIIRGSGNIVSGQPWYAGDHAIFAFGGTKCILIYTSDLFEECLSYTHCPMDTIDLVDEKLIVDAADFICKLIKSY